MEHIERQKGKRVYPYASLIISYLIFSCQQFIVMNLKNAKIFSFFNVLY